MILEYLWSGISLIQSLNKMSPPLSETFVNFFYRYLTLIVNSSQLHLWNYTFKIKSLGKKFFDQVEWDKKTHECSFHRQRELRKIYTSRSPPLSLRRIVAKGSTNLVHYPIFRGFHSVNTLGLLISFSVKGRMTEQSKINIDRCTAKNTTRPSSILQVKEITAKIQFWAYLKELSLSWRSQLSKMNLSLDALNAARPHKK